MSIPFSISIPYLGNISLKSLSPSQLVFMPYPPEPDDQFGYMEHHVTLYAEDGTELNGWFFNRGPGKPLVVGYHGKGCHIGWAVHEVAKDMERSYLLINYRGYGWSKGIATEKDLINDARRCIAWSREQIGGYSSLIIAGCSLGTGVAVQVAAAEKADKLILIAPYDCIYNAAVHLTRSACPKIPVSLLKAFCKASVGDLLRSVDYAPQVTCPVVIFMARTDDIIPHESTWNLYHAFTATHPQAVWVDCTHVNFFESEGFKDLFFRTLSDTPLVCGKEDEPWIMVNKGDDYYHGRNGYAQNPDKALEYYRRAADCNFHWGYYNVGKCYREGCGVTQDEDEARKWFRKAAEQQNFWALYALAEMGDADCMTEVGDCYYDGRAENQGCPRSAEKALHWYIKSAEHGCHWGYFNVGKCYVEGIGVNKDDAEARIWFRKAVEMTGNPWALRFLAVLGDTEAAMQISSYYETGSHENWGMMRNAEEAEYFRNLT